MSDYIFSAGISDEMRQNTEALCGWLRSNQNAGKDLPPILQQTIENGAVDVHAKCASFGYTPVHFSATNGHTSTIELLRECGVDLNARTNSCRTPLHLAAEGGRADTLEWLLGQNAELEARSDDGDTALHLAVREVGSNSIRVFLDLNVDPQNSDTIQKLLNHGANVNVLNDINVCPATADTTCADHAQQAQITFDAWHEKTLSPTELTKTHVMQMLNVWPLADPQAPVPRFEHLDAIFKDERWGEVDPQQKLDLIKEIPSLSRREQMYLLGGNAARVLMQKTETQQQSQGAER